MNYMHMYIFLLNFLENTRSFLIMPLHLRSPNNQTVAAWSSMQSSVQGAEASLSDSSSLLNRESSKALSTAVHVCDYRNLNCKLKKLPSTFYGWLTN